MRRINKIMEMINKLNLIYRLFNHVKKLVAKYRTKLKIRKKRKPGVALYEEWWKFYIFDEWKRGRK